MGSRLHAYFHFGTGYVTHLSRFVPCIVYFCLSFHFLAKYVLTKTKFISVPGKMENNPMIVES